MWKIVVLLVSKAICVNVQNLYCTQIMSLQAKLNACANSVVKSLAAWLAWRVTYEHIEIKGEQGRGRGHETKEVVTVETERSVIIRCYHYGSVWTWEQWHWRITLHSPKLQYYWNLTLRLFSVINKTLVVGWSYPSAEKQSEYSTASPYWAKPFRVEVALS